MRPLTSFELPNWRMLLCSFFVVLSAIQPNASKADATSNWIAHDKKITWDNMDTEFSVEMVRSDTKKYLAIVFGKIPPKVLDRVRLEGGETMEGDEFILDQMRCKNKFRGDEKLCGEYESEKYMNEQKSISLYYKLLRKKLKINPSQSRIESIKLMASGSPAKSVDHSLLGKCYFYYRVVVSTDDIGTELEFHHPAIYGHAAEDGYNRLISISTAGRKAMPILEYVGLEKPQPNRPRMRNDCPI